MPKIIAINTVIDRSGVTMTYGLDDEGKVWVASQLSKRWEPYLDNPTT